MPQRVNFYNDNDRHSAAWLRELVKGGLIPPGDVDERSITDIQPHELTKYCQCHFFAGIGGWSLALRLAGWPSDRPVWTGSCPCQPYSSAGKQLGNADARHLWPVFGRLIAQCRPPVVFGEQVASAIGKGWLDGVCADLEAEGYACGAAVLGAHSVGAPHIRQRLYWVADAHHAERRKVNGPIQDGCDWEDARRQEAHGELGTCGEVCGLGDAALYGKRTHGGQSRQGARQEKSAGGSGLSGGLAHSDGREPGDGGLQRGGRHLQQPENQDSLGLGDGAKAERWAKDFGWKRVSFSGDCGTDPETGELNDACSICGDSYVECECPGPTQDDEYEYEERAGILWARRLDHAERTRLEGHPGHGDDGHEPGRLDANPDGPTAKASGAWDTYDLLPCTDGKTRRTQSGLFPLAHGVPGRVGLLRGYGNAIVPPLAAQFIEAARKGMT